MTDDFAPLTPEELANSPQAEEPKQDARPFIRSSHAAPTPPRSKPLPGWRWIDGYIYRDKDGAPSKYVERLERSQPIATGRHKNFPNWSLRQDVGGPAWTPHDFPPGELSPLWNLPNIVAAKGKLKVLGEGEKAAIALGVIFGDTAVATTHAGGAKAVKKTDFTPLRDEPVLLWPDRDETGEKWCSEVGALLVKLGCKVSMVNVESLYAVKGDVPGIRRKDAGWDAADFILEWSEPFKALTEVQRHSEDFKPSAPRPKQTPKSKSAPAPGQATDDFNALIDAMANEDDAAAQKIMDAIADADPGLAVTEKLLKRLSTKLGTTLGAVRRVFAKAEKQADKRRLAAAAQVASEEAIEAARVAQAQAEQERIIQRNADAELCKAIRSDSNILDLFVTEVHQRGVIGEDRALKASYLTTVSRFLPDGAICLLLTGAPAGGKNYLLDRVLIYIQPEDIIRLTLGGTPTALIYFGEADDVEALKYKIIVLPEWASLLGPDGAEKPQAAFLRSFVSEGRVDHLVPVPNENGVRQSVRIVREGPTPFMSTTARPGSIEAEYETRLQTVEVDETSKQTHDILKAKFQRVAKKGDLKTHHENREKWLAYQRYLSEGKPYRVLIPFGEAIANALFKKYPNERLLLRVRRDGDGFIRGIQASAVMHKDSRDRDDKHVIATLDDYKNAHDAFDHGLRRFYGRGITSQLLTLVEALESLGVNVEALDGKHTPPVKVTYRQIANRLAYKSISIIEPRITDLENCEVLRVFRTGKKSEGRSYVLRKSSEELQNELAMGDSPDVFPTREQVEAELGAPDADSLFKGVRTSPNTQNNQQNQWPNTSAGKGLFEPEIEQGNSPEINDLQAGEGRFSPCSAVSDNRERPGARDIPQAEVESAITTQPTTWPREVEQTAKQEAAEGGREIFDPTPWGARTTEQGEQPEIPVVSGVNKPQNSQNKEAENPLFRLKGAQLRRGRPK
jgi:hypothetical protein